MSGQKLPGDTGQAGGAASSEALNELSFCFLIILKA